MDFDVCFCFISLKRFDLLPTLRTFYLRDQQVVFVATIFTIDGQVTVGLKTPVKFGDPCGPNQSFLIFFNERVVGFRCPPAFRFVHLACTQQPLGLRTYNMAYISCLLLDNAFCFISACGRYTIQLHEDRWNASLNNSSSKIYRDLKKNLTDIVSVYRFVEQLVYNLRLITMMGKRQ